MVTYRPNESLSKSMICFGVLTFNDLNLSQKIIWELEWRAMELFV